jgi:hypothetical protein
MHFNLFINYAKKEEEKKADFLLPCELLLLLCELLLLLCELLLLLRIERCPRFCHVGVEVSQCIDCSVVDL